MSRSTTRDAQEALNRFKYEVANEIGLTYNNSNVKVVINE